MRHFIFCALTLIIFGLSSNAVAEDSPLLPVEWDSSLAEPWSPPVAPSASFDEADTPTDRVVQVSEKVKWCQEFKIRWSESSARKLYRALRYHGTGLEEVDLQPWVDVQMTSRRGPQPFSVHPQHDGKSVGVVPLDPAWTKSYVVAQTKQGPVVASQIWPSPAELDDGATCRPVASQIEFPDERVVAVDIEPFRMWGMRVADKLPTPMERSTYEALVTVIRNNDGLSAAR